MFTFAGDLVHFLIAVRSRMVAVRSDGPINERLEKMEKSQGELLRLLSASAPRSELADSHRSFTTAWSGHHQQDIIDGKTSTGHHQQGTIDKSDVDQGHGTVTVIELLIYSRYV